MAADTTNRVGNRICSRGVEGVEEEFLQSLDPERFQAVCIRAGLVCAVQRFNFTTAIVVGLNWDGHNRRYCYEHRSDAISALERWDGFNHPGGPWIKCKGSGIDLLNPELDLDGP